MMKFLDFVECDACRGRPGTPPLCVGCLSNRQAISQLRDLVTKFGGEDALRDIYGTEEATMLIVANAVLATKGAIELQRVIKGDHPEANPTSWRFAFGNARYTLHLIHDDWTI